jgi:hypothetical protein
MMVTTKEKHEKLTVEFEVRVRLYDRIEVSAVETSSYFYPRIHLLSG